MIRRIWEYLSRHFWLNDFCEKPLRDRCQFPRCDCFHEWRANYEKPD